MQRYILFFIFASCLKNGDYYKENKDDNVLCKIEFEYPKELIFEYKNRTFRFHYIKGINAYIGYVGDLQMKSIHKYTDLKELNFKLPSKTDIEQWGKEYARKNAPVCWYKKDAKNIGYYRWDIDKFGTTLDNDSYSTWLISKNIFKYSKYDISTQKYICKYSFIDKSK